MLRIVAAVAASLLSLSAAAQTADWPTRTVRLIVPYPAGGTADLMARTIAEPLSEHFHHQFVVDNRAGSGGLIGSQALAQAAPDGYTIGISGFPPDVLAPAMNPNAGFNPMRSFTHIAFIGGPPNALLVNPALGVKTFQDFLALARKEKEPLNYASPGIGTVGNLIMEYLARKEHIGLQQIPYRGGSKAVTDLLAGHVKLASMAYATAQAHIAAGTIIAIAISSEERLPAMPKVPTLKELGYPDLVMTTWFSLSGPAGMPKAIVDSLNREVVAILQRPEVRKRLQAEAVHSKAMTAAQFTAFMQSEVDKWAPFARSVAGRKK
jgi:tripartite-type tricarboxylate transporter receptor subunit TctC